MTTIVEYSILCDGVWAETVLGQHEFGTFGLYEGECRSGRGENLRFTAGSVESAAEQAQAAGWYVESGSENAMHQCPDCHALSPVPATLDRR